MRILHFSNAISWLDSQWILLQLGGIVETTPCFNEMESFSQILHLAIKKIIIQNCNKFWQNVKISKSSDSLQMW